MDETYLSAKSENKFQRMRRRAFLKNILHFLDGSEMNLLSFEVVRKELQLRHARDLGVMNIEVDKIVGSMGRYEDFTREFLPRKDSQQNRWRRVFDLYESQEGVPPIDVFKVGDAYFVRDGNHRVSVARANNFNTIEAHVSEYVSPIPLEASDTFDDLMIKLGEANFLKTTRLNTLRPSQNIRLTNPGRYRLLLEHIAVHKYLIEVENQREFSNDEATASWYDQVYMPLVHKIREHDILKQFPGRTESDLYAWLVLHRASLEQENGLGLVDDDVVVEDLEYEAHHRPLWQRMITPNALPPAG
ncbi:MAG: hypothetical protein AAF629_16110 [Chloroflexota bacterium]